MTWPTIFANLAAGNQPLSLFDTMFSQVAQLVAIPCTASGANAIVLTPIGNAPTLSAYNNFQMFRFKAAGNSTAAVTVQFTGLSALPVFQKDGVTQCTSGSLVGGQEYLVCFDQSRNAGAGGFYLEDAAQPLAQGASPVWGPFTSIASAATTDLSLATTIDVLVTGTATITSFGAGINLAKVVRFAASLTLTNGANLVLPTGVNIVTQANDLAMCFSDASAVWYVIFQKHSGFPIADGAAGLPLVGQGAGVDPTYTNLNVPAGGTGANNFTAHCPLIGEGTNAIAATANAGSAGQVLTSNGASADPTFQNVPGTTIAPTVQLLTASQTVTIPANATKCKVTLVGGGGGGGGEAGANACGASIGGTGGTAAALVKYLSGLTPGNTLVLTIGAAGSGGASGANAGGNGGDTTLVSGTQSITTLTAGKGTGGAGGASGAVAANGTGGTATNGDLNFAGPVPKNSVAAWPGPTPLGFSPGMLDTFGGTTRVGTNALGFGGGGSGGFDPAVGVNAHPGGNGSAGCAIFEWYA